MKSFIRATLIRTVYTVAETALGIITTATLFNEIDWKLIVSASTVSGIVTILKCIIVGLPEVEEKYIEHIEK